MAACTQRSSVLWVELLSHALPRWTWVGCSLCPVLRTGLIQTLGHLILLLTYRPGISEGPPSSLAPGVILGICLLPYQGNIKTKQETEQKRSLRSHKHILTHASCVHWRDSFLDNFNGPDLGWGLLLFGTLSWVPLCRVSGCAGGSTHQPLCCGSPCVLLASSFYLSWLAFFCHCHTPAPAALKSG